MRARDGITWITSLSLDARQSRLEIRKSADLEIPIAAVFTIAVNLFLFKTNPLALYAIVSTFFLIVIQFFFKQLPEETKRTLAT